MKVLVIGGGRVGSQLAKLLLMETDDVRVVEFRPDVLTKLHREIPSERIIEGYPMDPEVLRRAGIEGADVLASCTRVDSLNLVMCYLAQEKYHIPRAISRINDPRNAWLYNETFAVDSSFNQAEILARMIEEKLSMGDLRSMVKLRKGSFSVVEERITRNAQLVGIPLKDLCLPQNCVIAAVFRGENVYLPNGDTVLDVDDEILAVTDAAGAERLSELLLS